MPGSPVAVGVIANPQAGRDLRRLATEATLVTTFDKLRDLRRILLGMAAFGPLEVLLAPDAEALVTRAYDALPEGRRGALRARSLSYPVDGDAGDTERAGRELAREGVGLVVTLGGDGTNRLVNKAAPTVPLLPFSTGTNNAFPYWIEATTLGMAAGVAGRFGKVDGRFARPFWRLHVETPDGPETALVDVAVSGGALRSTDIWEGRLLTDLFLTRGEPTALGLSSVLGWWDPCGPGWASGRHLRLSPGGPPNVRAPLGPGRIEPLCVEEVKALEAGVPSRIHGPAQLALDGEVVAVLAAGEEATVTLERGGTLLDPRALLTWAAKTGALRGGGPNDA